MYWSPNVRIRKKKIAKHDLAYCSSERLPEYLIISTLDLTAGL